VLAAVTVVGIIQGVGALAGKPPVTSAVAVEDAASGAVQKAPLTPYEVGRFKDLQSRSSVGDGLDLHHAGQAHAMKQVVPGYNRAAGPSIALPRPEHALVPNQRGTVSMSARDLLARDIRNLRNHTNAPNSSLQRLIKLNKEAFPEAFKK
jgi:hypothetical protein